MSSDIASPLMTVVIPVKYWRIARVSSTSALETPFFSVVCCGS